MLWKVSALKRIRHCGRVPVASAGHVSLRAREALAGYAGLQRCGSVWACPVCASRILVHRALEIGSVLGEAIRQGHALGFVTLTMRHHEGQSLDELWNAAGRGWRRSISGKGWTSTAELVDGWVRVWEVTRGRNGWHVHVHLVLVLAPGSSASDLEVVASGMWERWRAGLLAAGMDAPLRVGQDWHLATGENAADDLSSYLSKSVAVVDSPDLAAGLGLELTHGMAGRAREGLATRPVWSLLDDMAETGEIGPWREWEKASKGRKQVGWSNGLRERFAPALDDLSDQAVVDQVLGDETDDLVWWTSDQWKVFVAHPTRARELLDVAQFGGRASVHALIEEWGDVSCSLISLISGAGGRGAAKHPPAPPLRGRGVQAGWSFG